MAKLFKLAWRDIWRNRRRSFITMGAVVFAVLLITLANSVQHGTYDAMEEVAVRLFMGDVQVHRDGFQDERTLSYSLEEDEQNWDSLMTAQPWIEAYSRRLSGFGLLSSDSASAGSVILGIEPEREPRLTTFASRVAEGAPLEVGDRQAVLLGQTLAKNLGLVVGDTVVVLTQGYQNQMGADLYAVKGLVRSGSPDVDRGMMIMTLPDAQFLFSMDGRFTELIVRTRDFRSDARHAAVLHDALGDPDGRYEVMGWRELMPELIQTRKFDDAGNYIFYAFLLVIVGFEIFNTTMMSMMERVREFGVMMSIGMKPRQISLLIILELVLKVALAIGAGLFITFLAIQYLKDHPIPIGGDLQQLYEDWGFTIEGIAFSPRPVVFIWPLLSVSLVSAVAMLYPMIKMRTFAPVEALRTT